MERHNRGNSPPRGLPRLLVYGFLILFSLTVHAEDSAQADEAILYNWISEAKGSRLSTRLDARKLEAAIRLESLEKQNANPSLWRLQSITVEPITDGAKNANHTISKSSFDSLIELNPTASFRLLTPAQNTLNSIKLTISRGIEQGIRNSTTTDSKNIAKELALHISAINKTQNIIQDDSVPKSPTPEQKAREKQFRSDPRNLGVLEANLRPAELTKLSCGGAWSFPGQPIFVDWNRACAPTANLQSLVNSVGKLVISGSPGGTFVNGTGFLVAHNIIMTNEHVISGDSNFAIRASPGSTYKMNDDLHATIDFDQEACGNATALFAVTKILAVDSALDMALLEIDTRGKKLVPLPLSRQAVRLDKADYYVAIAGYPNYPTESDDLEEIRRINQLFGVSLGKRRIAPGKLFPSVTSVNGKAFSFPVMCHDCSTEPGNSGSPLVDLKREVVIGLHFEGDGRPYKQRIASLAVPLSVIAKSEAVRDISPQLNWVDE